MCTVSRWENYVDFNLIDDPPENGIRRRRNIIGCATYARLCGTQHKRALACGDIRRVAGEAPAKTKGGKCGARHATATLNEVKEMRPARTEIIICTGLRTKGGQQLWGDLATSLWHDRRQKG